MLEIHVKTSAICYIELFNPILMFYRFNQNCALFAQTGICQSCILKAAYKMNHYKINHSFKKKKISGDKS